MLVLTTASLPVFGQDKASVPEEVIKLSPFTVTTDNASRYQVDDSTSSGRVRVALFDAPQSISVLTRDFIEDVGAVRVLDAAKYVSGVTESTVPNSLDRVMIRGFQSDGHIIDGFRSISQANMDPAIVDRIEVVKGPNAVLSPTGVPGGTINLVAKKPRFGNFGSVSVQAGEYDANRAEVDINRMVGANAAIRLVAAAQDSDSYYQDSFQRSWVVSPSVSWRFGRDSQLTLQMIANRWRSTAYLGLPLDPSVGPDSKAVVLAGVPLDFNPYTADDVRADQTTELKLFYTGSVTDRLAVRLAVRYMEDDYWNQSTSLGGTAGGAINPTTGLWTPGFTYGPAPTFTPVPATTSRNYSRGGSYVVIPVINFNVQNDYAYTFETEKWKSTTVLGIAVDHFSEIDFIQQPTTKPVFNIDAFTPAAPTYGAVNFRHDDVVDDEQVFVQQSLALFKERLHLTGGLSKTWFHLSAKDRLKDTRVTFGPDKTLPNASVLFKPAANIALYGTYSESASAPNASSPRETVQTGKQYEVGARFKLLNNRLTATVAYWNIRQDNISIPNAGNLTVPAPNPPLPAIITDRIADGWEFEFNGAITKEFSVIGNYTTFTSRDPNGVPFRGVAETSGGVWLNYLFHDGSFKGLSVGLGASYTGKRPGEQASGFAAGSTPTQVIPNQPSFWLPAQTLLDLNIGYKFNRNWKANLRVKNLTDEDYLAASLSRFLVYPGIPRNVVGSVTYSF